MRGINGPVAAASVAALLLLAGCGGSAQTSSVVEPLPETETDAAADVATDAASEAEADSEQTAAEDTPAGQRESALDYSEIARWSYEFSSGAGGWATELTIDAG